MWIIAGVLVVLAVVAVLWRAHAARADRVAALIVQAVKEQKRHEAERGQETTTPEGSSSTKYVCAYDQSTRERRIGSLVSGQLRVPLTRAEIELVSSVVRRVWP